MSEDLKPCPFCKGLDVVRYSYNFSNNIHYQCPKCGCHFIFDNKSKDTWNTRPAEDALKYDLAQKKAALLVISQWCDRGLKDGMRKHDMNEVFLWIRKLAKEEMEKDYDTDR